MPEGSTYPLHPWEKVFDAVFLGSACQFATLHRIKFESRDGVLSKRIGPIRFAICARLYDCAAVGRLVAAVDGIETLRGDRAFLDPARRNAIQ